jgi:hypothetical protein
MELLNKRGSSRCKHCRGEVAVCVLLLVSTGFASPELPYAVSEKALGRTTWVMRFHAGQFRGFWGSSDPSQSTALSFVFFSIALWSGTLDCWLWWPFPDMAGFSWADFKSAAMICCRWWCDSAILGVCSLAPGFACYIYLKAG